ncbi:DUF4018 domain-containing protein [Bacillus cereus group sp. BfR-BA-01380]|uniref:DUF4018 domain-containing protein n=1 Tax=Bacillus cereus group sp. BfR-BA-01380 TaxID=2920324 RepID=UPI001F58877C|nr:DUF4018 domain-containing protein [Bacillus cereus group sp. BfR-BA-01380]
MNTWLRYVNNFILLLLLSLLTEKGEFVHIVLFLLVSHICLLPIIKIRKNKKTWFAALFILQIIACYSLALFSSISSVLLPFFFLLVYAKDDISPFHKLLGAFLWSFCSILLHMQLPNILEIGLLILHTFLTLWITSFNRNQQILRLFSIIAIGVIGFLFLPLLSYIRTGIAYAIQWIALGLGYILNPLFLAAEQKQKDDSLNLKLGQGTSQPPPPIPEKGYDPFILQCITILIIVVAAIYVIWKLYKKRHEINLGRMSSYEPIVVGPEQGNIQKRNRKLRPPNSTIRKEIFKLEKKLKPPLNRQRGETVEKWMERLRTEGDIYIQSNIIIEAYSTARYGEKEDSTLLQQFKNETNTLYHYKKVANKKK